MSTLSIPAGTVQAAIAQHLSDNKLADSGADGRARQPNACAGNGDGCAAQASPLTKDGGTPPNAQSIDVTASTARCDANRPPIRDGAKCPPCLLDERLVPVNMGSIRVEDIPDVEYHAFLGSPGYIVRGATTLLAASPKVGKTELVTQLALSWSPLRVCILSEEPMMLWLQRRKRIQGDWANFDVVSSPCIGHAAVVQFIRYYRYDVYMIDTMRGVLDILDENDNSVLVRSLMPVTTEASKFGSTLIITHHLRKQAGQGGTAVAGGSATIGAMDTFLEISHEGSDQSSRRRRVTGRGRYGPIEDCVYEMQDDGSLTLIGSPAHLRLDAVKQRVVGVLSSEWKTRSSVSEELGAPQPSDSQLQKALKDLVADARVERDPKEDKPGATYRFRLSGRTQEAPSLAQSNPIGAGHDA